MSKEHPILFSTPMVQAILRGKKTQTRRVVKPQPEWDEEDIKGLVSFRQYGDNNEFRLLSLGLPCMNPPYNTRWKSPYGIKGDRLWVRETFADICQTDQSIDSNNGWIYRASVSDDDNHHVSWKRSIFMPREASRITLEIVDVRVERLQDMSINDLKCEGFSYEGLLSVAQSNFKSSWDKLYDERGNGWDVNPWVWVIEFKVIS